MKPIDPAAEGALDDPASTYADCRAVVERGLAELQVRINSIIFQLFKKDPQSPWRRVTSPAGQCCMMQQHLQHVKRCLLRCAAAVSHEPVKRAW